MPAPPTELLRATQVRGEQVRVGCTTVVDATNVPGTIVLGRSPAVLLGVVVVHRHVLNKPADHRTRQFHRVPPVRLNGTRVQLSGYLRYHTSPQGTQCYR
jgi:hypothetical protein